MIRLSGKEPDRDVPIDYVGARPGEKLHEELWGDDEEVRPTSHPKILRVKRRAADAHALERELESLETLVEGGETLEVVARLRGLVSRGVPPRGRRPRRPWRSHRSDTVSRGFRA